MDDASDPKTVARRYEALGRAIARRIQPSLFVCIGATVAVTVIWILLTVPLIETLVPVLDAIPVLVLILAGLISAVVLIPSGLQWLVLGENDRAMLEGFNAFALLNQEHVPERTRFMSWRLRNPQAALKWMESHRTNPADRVGVLLWAGRIEEADGLIREWPSEFPHQRFRREILASLADYVRGLPAPLGTAESIFETIPEGPEREHAKATLAVETARRALTSGGDWQAPLIELRRTLRPLPKGATFADQFKKGARLTIGVIVASGAIGFVVGAFLA